MTVLVTGGAGFVGSHVAEYYAKLGIDIIVFDNLLRAETLGSDQRTAFYNWNYLKDNYSNVRLIKGDVRESNEVVKASKGVEIIIHTAAQVAVTTSIKDPKTDFEINTLGTFNVLEAARRSKMDPTVIYCSTNKVYGSNVNNIPVVDKETRYFFTDKRFKSGIPEDFPLDLCEHTPYGCSKLAGDFYAQDHAHTYGLKTGVFRMSCIYGERQFGTEDQGWLAWFTIATLLNKSITIYGDGKQVRDVLHISDLINAYDSFVNSNLNHGIFNIGGGSDNTLSLLELLNMLETLTGKRAKVGYSEWRAGDQRVYISDITCTQDKLGWRPKISPREGVRKLVDWVNHNKDLLSPQKPSKSKHLKAPLQQGMQFQGLKRKRIRRTDPF